jgi:hypothetical protein
MYAGHDSRGLKNTNIYIHIPIHTYMHMLEMTELADFVMHFFTYVCIYVYTHIHILTHMYTYIRAQKQQLDFGSISE